MKKAPPIAPLAVSVNEAARLIGVSNWTIYKMGRDGVLTIRKLKGTERSVVLYADLVDYLDKSQHIEAHRATQEAK